MGMQQNKAATVLLGEHCGIRVAECFVRGQSSSARMNDTAVSGLNSVRFTQRNGQNDIDFPAPVCII